MFRAAGANVAISLDEEGEPFICLEFYDQDGQTVDIVISDQDAQSLMPLITEVIVRSRTVREMVTTWPEQKNEILANLLFRWAGVVEDENGTETR